MMFLFTTNLLCSVGVLFKQAVGISMGIDCVPLDLVQKRIIHEKQGEAKSVL
jgi:hypothetical protein